MTETNAGNRWLPLAGATMLNLALGTFYGWSVFVLPLEQEFNWVRQDTSWTFSVGMVSFAVTFVLAGRLHATWGFRPIAAFGGLLFSVGFLLASLTNSLWWLYFAYGVLGGVGNGFGYSVGIPVISRWFPDKRGLALGIAIGGYGAGSGIFGPLADSLIGSIGWEATFQLYGVLFFVMTMTGAYLLKSAPDGYAPEGWEPTQLKAAVQTTAREITPGEMLRGSTFYLLWAAYFFGSMAGLGLISQLVPFGTQVGIGSVALIGLVVGSIGNTSGRVLSGLLSDQIGRLNVLRLMVLVSAVAMPLLYLLGSTVFTFAVGIFVVYYCYGTLLAVFPATSADFFGTRHLGVNYGLLFLAWGAGALVAAPLAGLVFDTFGDYRLAFFGASMLSLVALGALTVAKYPRQAAA